MVTPMPPAERQLMASNDDEIDEVELARLGIRRVEGKVYQYGEYIFSNVRDAIVAAKREGNT